MKKKPHKKNQQKATKLTSVSTLKASSSTAQEAPEAKSTLKGLVKWVVIGSSILSTVIGILGVSLYPAFKPKITLTPSTTTNASKPFGTSIELTNQNEFFSITNVSPILFIDSLVWGYSNGTARNSLLEDFRKAYNRIDPLEAYTFHYNFENVLLSDDPVTYSNALYRVRYKFLGFNCKDDFYFESVRDDENRYTWRKTPKKSFVAKLDSIEANDRLK